MRPRTVARDLSEILFLCELEREPQHGYKLRQRMLRKYGCFPAISTIYNMLYRYERLGLLKSHSDKNKRGQFLRIYALTEKGKLTARQIRMIISKF